MNRFHYYADQGLIKKSGVAGRSRVRSVRIEISQKLTRDSGRNQIRNLVAAQIRFSSNIPHGGIVCQEKMAGIINIRRPLYNIKIILLPIKILPIFFEIN